MKINPIFQLNEDITIENYLSKCGVSDVEEYLNPNGKYIEEPMLYENMIEAVQLFKYHYLQKSPTFILSDADFDGVSSAFITYDYMKHLNPNWDIKILIHEGKVRGLDDKKLFDRVMEKKRPFLIIPDAGTNCKIPTRKVFDNGIDVLVLEHHDIQKQLVRAPGRE